MFTKALWVSRNAERSKGTSTELYSYAIIQGKEEKFGQEEKTKEKSFIVGIDNVLNGEKLKYKHSTFNKFRRK